MPGNVEERAIEAYKALISELDEENISVPLEEKVSAENILKKTVEDWKNSRKTLRTIPTLELLEEKFSKEIDEKLVKALTALDLQINTLDDIVDTKDPEKEERIKMATQAAYSPLLLQQNLDEKEEIIQTLSRYYYQTLQTTKIEGKKLEELKRAGKDQKIIEAAEQSYQYRARDIEIFGEVVGSYLELEEEKKGELIAELKDLRAIEILWKDLRDIERDIQDEDPTPIIVLMEKFEVSKAYEIIASIYNDLAEEVEAKSQELPEKEVFIQRLENAGKA